MRRFVTSLPFFQHVINLGSGFPNPSLYPIDELRESFLATHLLDDDFPNLFNSQATLMDTFSYPPNRGSVFLRESLVDLLSDRYCVEIPDDSLLVHHGISEQLLYFLNRFRLQYTTSENSSPVMVVEDPTYPFLLSALTEIGIQLIPCPTDSDGICLDSLHDILIENPDVGFVYVIPTFHNPTGHVLTQQRRLDLIRLSREFDFLVISDEAYLELSLGDPSGNGSPVPLCLDDDCDMGEGSVISLHSFSKTLAPGFRLGYAQVSNMSGIFQPIDRPAGWAYIGGSGNPLIGRVVAEMISSGLYSDWVAELRAKYANRANMLCGALEEQKKGLLKFDRPEGGYFVWIRVGDSREVAQEFRENCLEAGVSVMDGAIATLRPEESVSSLCVRVCFGLAEEAELVEGGLIMAEVADSLCQ